MKGPSIFSSDKAFASRGRAMPVGPHSEWSKIVAGPEEGTSASDSARYTL